LAWVLRQKAVTSAIIGASRVAQVEDGARTVDNLALTGDELRTIERALQA
jgi:L-glyceraldehyde 3-phosphate reductase